MRDLVAEALRDHRPASFAERIVRPDGGVRHLHSWAAVSVDEAGNAREVFGTCLDLTEVIGTVTDLRRTERWLARALGSQQAPPSVIRCDRQRIEQLVVNLAMNARDAMPDGGTLRLATGTAGDELWLEVADTGTGMTPEVQARIFEPFYSTKERGSGVGLATVRDLVAQCRGRVEVRSAPGAGTTMRVVLPRS